MLLGLLLAGLTVLWLVAATAWAVDGIERNMPLTGAIAALWWLLALALLARPLRLWRKAGRLIYAVTNERAIVLEQARQSKAESFDADDLRYVEARRGGRGSKALVFRPRGPYSTDGFAYRDDTGFLAIDDLDGAEAALWQIQGFREPVEWRMSRGAWALLIPGILILGMGGMLCLAMGTAVELSLTRQAGRTDAWMHKTWAGLRDMEDRTLAGVRQAEGRLFDPGGDCGPRYEIVLSSLTETLPVVGDDEGVWPLARRINDFVAGRGGERMRIVLPARKSIGLMALFALVFPSLGAYILTVGLQVLVDGLRRRPLRQPEQVAS